MAIFAHLSKSLFRSVASRSSGLVASDNSRCLGTQEKGTGQVSRCWVTSCPIPPPLVIPHPREDGPPPSPGGRSPSDSPPPPPPLGDRTTTVHAGRSHGVMVSTPGPTSRRRQLPAVPAGPEWHNTAASATPCATLREPPPPFPALSLSTPHGMGSYRADHTAAPPCRSLCTQGPQCIQFCQSNEFCMGTHPMPSVLPKVINFAWAHTQCLQFCQK